METSHQLSSWQTNCKSANQSGPFRQSFEPNLPTDVLQIKIIASFRKRFEDQLMYFIIATIVGGYKFSKDNVGNATLNVVKHRLKCFS